MLIYHVFKSKTNFIGYIYKNLDKLENEHVWTSLDKDEPDIFYYLGLKVEKVMDEKLLFMGGYNLPLDILSLDLAETYEEFNVNARAFESLKNVPESGLFILVENSGKAEDLERAVNDYFYGNEK